MQKNNRQDRELILETIRKAKPAHVDLPEFTDFNARGIDLEKAFRQMVIVMGGRVFNTFEQLEVHYSASTQSIISTCPQIKSTIDLNQIRNPDELEGIDLVVMRGHIGVAENGAVWVQEQDNLHRVLPFISQHLALVVRKEAIVENMHQAYQMISLRETGFGVFIAGPSKTADIEQSLVIGAQGPRSFSVVLTA